MSVIAPPRPGFWRGVFYFIVSNLFLLLLMGFFTYRTFFEGKLNKALGILLVALFLLTVCRAISQYREHSTTTLVYRGLVLVSMSLLIGALCIQTYRFLEVFLPTLSASPTVSRVLVRVGIATTTFYVYALVAATVYYLYTHQMTGAIWNGSLDRVLENTVVARKREDWRRVRFSTLVLLNIGWWGGLASLLTLAVGFVAWLLR